MTTAAQWEHMAREANAATVKAMAEADRLRAELRAAGGQEKPSEPTNWHRWDCNRTNCPGCYDGPRPS